MGNAPAWCEMQFFEIVQLAPGEERTMQREGEREKLIVVEGEVDLGRSGSSGVVRLAAGAQHDMRAGDGSYTVAAPREGPGETIVVRMCGAWGDETGGSGLFSVVNADDPGDDGGDPVDYPKTTRFDRHFHDCDEYWIIVRGRGVAVSEGRSYEVGPGDCIATGMGHHHDFPQVFEPVKAVYFETTLRGRKRRGHLWEHTHGPAEPDPARV